MASATVDPSSSSSTANPPCPLQLESIPIVDLRLLSQSDLYSLSLCASSAFDPRRCDDVVIPKIDRSVFNESAGSRKQTYSRLRLAPPSSSLSLPATAPRRRTPHLRATFPSISNNYDPENAENAQIVALLRQLFVPDINPEDLVPVKIDYSDSIRPLQLPLAQPSPSPPNVGSTVGHKRKRGRPRRNEMLGSEQDLASGSSVVDASEGGDVSGDGAVDLNEIVVREDGDNRDMEVLNRDGVAVDLVALGRVEHPYVEEIRRRTEGLGTEVELLGYLRGLSGQWGSRRKKKMVVDASDFGDVLPMGWKLSLSVKKKNGQVWLYCRRYISPSGLHFVSCKGVASHLLSLHGVQETDPYSSDKHNEIVTDADKLNSVPIADLANQHEDIKENPVIHTLPAFGSSSCNHPTQVMINVGDFSDGKVGEMLHSDNHNMTFGERDELWQHQSSLHQKKKQKHGVRITDGVIIKDGKFECQFCHKTFIERHRYNGHIGAHVRHQAKIDRESASGGVGEYANPNSYHEFPVRDTTKKGSSGSENVLVFCNSNTNQHAGGLAGANENIRGSKGTDKVDAIPCSVAESIFSGIEKKDLHEAPDKALGNGCSAETIVDGSSLQGTRSGNSSPFPPVGVMNGAIENAALIEKNPEQNIVSESNLPDSHNHVEACDVVADDENICQTRNELKLECDNSVVKGSMLDSSESRGRDNDLADGIKQPSNLNDLPCKNIDATSDASVSAPLASRHNKESNASRPPAPEEKACTKDIVPSLLDKYAFHESIFGAENNDGAENNNDEVSGRKIEDAFECFPNFRNDESCHSFGTSQTAFESSSVMGNEQDRNVRVYPGFTSATDKQFFRDDNMNNVFDCALEEHKKEQPGSLLRSHPSVPGGSEDEFTLNKIYATPVNQSKLNEIENTGSQELNLSFGNFQPELCTGSNKVEQEEYSAETLNIQLVDHKAYGDQTHSNIISSNIPGDLKQGRLFGIDFPDSSFNNQTHELVGSVNMAHPGRNWTGPRGHEIGTSSQSFVVGFGTSSSQSGGCVTDDASWRTDNKNVFQGCSIATSSPQIESSSYFRPFDITSDKGEESSFGVYKNYGVHADFSRTQPVEYSFMGEPSSNSLPVESKMFSYASNIEQGLDSSFWRGKDALMQNTTANNNQVTSVCVWCRNVFFHEPNLPVTQAGSIGTMCPSCSSRIPGQFNVL